MRFLRIWCSDELLTAGLENIVGRIGMLQINTQLRVTATGKQKPVTELELGMYALSATRPFNPGLDPFSPIAIMYRSPMCH